jgi:hypothetical protein
MDLSGTIWPPLVSPEFCAASAELNSRDVRIMAVQGMSRRFIWVRLAFLRPLQLAVMSAS